MESHLTTHFCTLIDSVAAPLLIQGGPFGRKPASQNVRTFCEYSRRLPKTQGVILTARPSADRAPGPTLRLARQCAGNLPRPVVGVGEGTFRPRRKFPWEPVENQRDKHTVSYSSQSEATYGPGRLAPVIGQAGDTSTKGLIPAW